MSSSAEPPSRGPYRKGLARREQIVQTAIEVFSTQGYFSGSMREIAKRSGVTPAGLLHHFTSKEELLLEVLDRRDTSIAEAVDRLRPRSVGERVAAVIAHNEEHHGLTTLFAVLSAEATSPEHPAHEYFTTRYERQQRATVDSLRADQERGLVDPTLDPEVVAATITALSDGLQLQQSFMPAVNMSEIFEVFRKKYLEPPHRN